MSSKKQSELFHVFRNQKLQTLTSADLSRKGSLDKPIVELVNFINIQECYVTTSSCSGRVIIYEENVLNKEKKKGCNWLYTTHSEIKLQEVLESANNVSGDAFFKFEPFVLHVHCQTLEDARLMHEAAVASGFRNSGLSISGKGKIIAAIRSTHSLEAPISIDGKLIVNEKYFTHLAKIADEKMRENIRRIDRFYENIRIGINKKQEKPAPVVTKQSKDKRTFPSRPVKPEKIDTKTMNECQNYNEDPFLSIMDECTMDTETGLFSIIYTEDG